MHKVQTKIGKFNQNVENLTRTDRQTDRQTVTQGNTAWTSHNYTSIFPMGGKQATGYLHVPFRD